MWSCLQVANAVSTGLTEFTHDQVKKGNLVAVYSVDENDNHGLPFWIGKVADVLEHAESEDDEEEDDADIGVTYDIKIEEYRQTNARGTSGKYEPNVVAGASKRGTSRTTASKVINVVPLAQICHVFTSLTGSKTIPAPEKSWIAFNCEVAARTRAFDINRDAVTEFNTSCGFKTMPFT